MWFFSFWKQDNEAAKAFVKKEYFNSATQKKAVIRAARLSAEDQRLLVERYREIVGDSTGRAKNPA